jgi:hypothetical protein
MQESALQPALLSLLANDERLLWFGRPKQGLVLRGSDAFMIPFSLLWGGFAIFWEASVIAAGSPWFAVFGLPFVFVGLYMICGRFWLEAISRKKTIYGITSQRIVILSGVLSTNVRSLTLRTLSDVNLSQKQDGSGTITFGPVNWWNTWYGSAGWPGMDTTPAFYLSSNAQEVFQLIRRAQQDELRPSQAAN